MANDEGYSKIATLMSCHSEFAIFRRFSKLNFQNLLYLQSELCHLEADLKELAERDHTEPGRAMYSKYWWHLSQSEEDHDDREQWEKVLQIREKLKEYSMSISKMSLDLVTFFSAVDPTAQYGSHLASAPDSQFSPRSRPQWHTPLTINHRRSYSASSITLASQAAQVLRHSIFPSLVKATQNGQLPDPRSR
jgi:hypothetical protein